MATASEIAEVRYNVDEPRDAEDYTNAALEELIDINGVNGTSAIIWRRKAAEYTKLVDVAEAGASMALGTLMKKALEMAAQFDAFASSGGGGVVDSSTRVKVKTIERP